LDKGNKLKEGSKRLAKEKEFLCFFFGKMRRRMSVRETN
jgi:hypothetical protein